jgi:hypothetical protein
MDQDKTSPKVVLMGRVLVGSSCVGSKATIELHKNYQTTCDSTNNVFVTYDDCQSYPEYVISYTLHSDSSNSLSAPVFKDQLQFLKTLKPVRRFTNNRTPANSNPSWKHKPKEKTNKSEKNEKKINGNKPKAANANPNKPKTPNANNNKPKAANANTPNKPKNSNTQNNSKASANSDSSNKQAREKRNKPENEKPNSNANNSKPETTATAQRGFSRFNK